MGSLEVPKSLVTHRPSLLVKAQASSEEQVVVDSDDKDDDDDASDSNDERTRAAHARRHVNTSGRCMHVATFSVRLPCTL